MSTYNYLLYEQIDGGQRTSIPRYTLSRGWCPYQLPLCLVKPCTFLYMPWLRRHICVRSLPWMLLACDVISLVYVPGRGWGGGAALSAWEPVVTLVRCLTDLWHRYMIWWFASGEVLPLPHTNACGDSYHLGRNPYRPMCWFVFMQTYTVWHHCFLHARFVWELVNWVCSGLILTHPSHFLSSLAMTYFTNFNTKVTPCLCHARVCNITINPYIAPLCQVSYPLWQLNSFAMEHMKFWVLSQNNPEDPKLVMIKNRSTRIFY